MENSLSSAIEHIGSGLSANSILDRLLDVVCCLEHPPAAWVLLPSAEAASTYTVVNARGLSAPPLGEKVELPSTPCDYPVATASLEPAAPPFDSISSSLVPFVGLPLLRDGRTLAVLCVMGSLDNRGYLGSAVPRLRLLASFAAIAMANLDLTSSLDRVPGQLREWIDSQTRELLADNERLRRLHEQAERLATVDGLTGLRNHRYYWQRLTEELARAKRFGRPFTVLFMDVDGLKEVNDRYGHIVGDRVLGKMGELVAGATRSCDVAARYGGDEFAVLLIETGREAAAIVAERLRERSGSEFITGEQDQSVPVRFSLGIATFPEDGVSEWELIHVADRASYRQKRSREIAD